jgi:hypothetical protein
MRFKNLPLIDFAVFISDHLCLCGIRVVLTGGACVSIYTDNKYMSYDLDLVLVSSEEQKKTKALILALGFVEEGRYFRHPDAEFFLDFLSPPLSVGSEPVKQISEIKKGKRILRLLSPTDCVKDRLAAFYHWNDKQALEQAVLVCRDQSVDLAEVRRWSTAEAMAEKFKTFKLRLSRNS